MYGIEPRFTKPQFSELLNLANRFGQPKLKIYLNITKQKTFKSSDKYFTEK